MGAEQGDAGDENDGSEYVTDKVKMREELEAAKEEGGAHDDGAEHAPGEDAVLVVWGDAEAAEEDEEEEEIVDAERLLEQVSAGELCGEVAAEVMQQQQREGGGE